MEERRNQPDVARILGHYRTMQRIRAFEEAAEAAQKEGLVTGAVHLSIGQEAVAAGVCGNLEKTDLITSNHRGHGHTLAKGADPVAMMRELFGREGGTCGGKGGSMHIADFSIGMLGANGVVADGIPIAAGAAHGAKIRGEKLVTVCFFGDGAINRGPFLEGLNWAAVFDLPVLFVCEDNGYASTTETRAVTAGPGPSARAESLGVPAHDVDGNDIVAVDTLAAELIGRMRNGGGPAFITASTYRLKGHTAADPATYRRQEDVEAAYKREPALRVRQLLTDLGVSVSELDRIADEAQAEMVAAAETAKATPHPDLREAYTDVQDVGAVAWPN
ncbi:MAG: thiamine pyrophosphate-dependent dehydrogenase E1 component subunit alpha [Minwuiales bacterium]|nr:thiamine pyrophosphate-dependent dehydrogenase E1 component subunit alpha [Minwuiales bacterium]